MEIEELQAIIRNGEDFKNQFKKTITRAESLAKEFVAFSNSDGGNIIIGVADEGEIIGLSFEEINRLSKLVSSTSSNNISPTISVKTEIFMFPQGRVMLVRIFEGSYKPYTDNKGDIYVKTGADKRKVIAPEEMRRIFQRSGHIHADQTLVKGTKVGDLDFEFFSNFYQNKYEESIENQSLSTAQLIENMGLAKNGELNYGAIVLFAKRPQNHLPGFIVKAVAFYGTDITEINYRDSKDFNGKLSDIFENSVRFILSNIHYIQGEKDFNSIGDPEIPRLVIKELLINALVHRDYFISAPIRVLVFKDRIEIISPGNLPNNLKVEQIKMGVSNARNPIITTYANDVLSYRGSRSGILRSLRHYPQIEFVDDRTLNLFKVVIQRKTHS